MILSKKDTALLKAAIDCEANLFYWMKNCSELSNNEYADLRANFEAWKELYDENDLFGTNANDSTFQFSGIDQFPIPPSR